jgi:prepilin-type N-terminal cleavage/methylation domain-containing protein
MLAPIVLLNFSHPPKKIMRKSSAFTLIELLIVIAIIGILMGMLFPAMKGAIDAAKKAQAKNDATQIATAVIAYETEYGKLPLSTKITVDKALVDALAGIDTGTNNPRGIVFLDVQAAKKGKSGTNSSGFVDPWSTNTPYSIAMDIDYDNNISVSTNGAASGPSSLRKKVGVWNVNSNTRRQVRSWD